jgi:hypothetical protein
MKVPPLEPATELVVVACDALSATQKLLWVAIRRAGRPLTDDEQLAHVNRAIVAAVQGAYLRLREEARNGRVDDVLLGLLAALEGQADE